MQIHNWNHSVLKGKYLESYGFIRKFILLDVPEEKAAQILLEVNKRNSNDSDESKYLIERTVN